MFVPYGQMVLVFDDEKVEGEICYRIYNGRDVIRAGGGCDMESGYWSGKLPDIRCIERD